MAFVKGQSGNPGGRPKEAAEVKALAIGYSVEAIHKLHSLMGSPDEKIQLAASIAMMDRGLGKPTQAISGDNDADPIRILHEADQDIIRRFLETNKG